MTEHNDKLPRGFKNRLDLSRHATPRPLRETPIHNWFVFPHSYSHILVNSLLDHWGLNRGSRIYDPFVGAGTTLLATNSRGIEAVGADISPLAVFVTNAKVTSYDAEKLKIAWNRLQKRLKHVSLPCSLERSGLLEQAFDFETHRELHRIRCGLLQEKDSAIKQFFLLALLRMLPHFSRMLPDGGWFRWRRVRARAESVYPRYAQMVERMLRDLPLEQGSRDEGRCAALQHDSRWPLRGYGKFDALITSPPYPNRHDYTRIFTTELLFLFLDADKLKQLRFINLRSHVEARPPSGLQSGWHPPQIVQDVLQALSDVRDKRVPRMILGYFEDMYLTLQSARQMVKPGGRLAYVVGNVQHAGVSVPVDLLLAKVGTQVGLKWRETWVVRLRGNSAQQMGRYGRKASRESIVIFERP